MLERYQATLIGCACGDTLGMPVEGWKKEQIQKYVGKKITEPIGHVVPKDPNTGDVLREDEFGRLHNYTRDYQKGEYTDDTILTLAIAEAIVEARGLDLDTVAKKHIQAYKDCLQPNGYLRGGFGKTTRKAIKNLMDGNPPLEAGIPGGAGNGPAMKMSPIGLYASAVINSNRSPGYLKTLEFAEKVGLITHQDPRSVASGVVQTHAIYLLLDGIHRKDFLNSITGAAIIYEDPPDDQVNTEYKGTLAEKLIWITNNTDKTPEEAFSTLGNDGLVYRSYPFAIFMFQKYWDDPINAIIETVNWGGDCDTTGAIVGSLVGAKHGMIFPSSWKDALIGAERLLKAAEGIYSLRK